MAPFFSVRDGQTELYTRPSETGQLSETDFLDRCYFRMF
jgi:hypothetical protein